MPNAAPSRRELEDLWRGRVQAALRRYQLARADAAAARTAFKQGDTPSPDGSMAVHQRHQIENAALADYDRVLSVFNDLVLRGKLPPDSENGTG
jgi:hypothetical protein